MKNLKINKRLLLLTFLVLIISLFLFNDLGLIKLHSLRKERTKIQHQIDDLIIRKAHLDKEIQKIKNNDIYLEKIAREKFQMVKPGEKVFRVIQNRNIN